MHAGLGMHALDLESQNPREFEVHAGSCMHALDLKSQRIQFMPGHALQFAWYGISRYRSTCEYYYFDTTEYCICHGTC